jgi:hypothetical protein
MVRLDRTPMKRIAPLVLAATMTLAAHAAPPQAQCWFVNITGRTGYGGYEADVQSVKYDANYVYVQCSSVPGYSIGPWPGNPGSPIDGNWSFRITRNPQPRTGTRTATGLGQIGVWTNGVCIFSASDARSYNNRNVWHQNAIVVEGPGFDSCGGHPAQTQYHNHQNAACMYDPVPTEHSPIVGFGFDGFPVYGPFGYANTDGTGGIKRIKSSYRLRSITQRTTLPDGTALTSTNYGPAVSSTYPLGYYIEDHEYVSGLGDLNDSNARFCVTPEFPQGTWAYFVTTDNAGSPAYPYLLGPTYMGTLDTANTGPTGGHVTVPATAVTFDPVDLDESGSVDAGDIGALLLLFGSRGPLGDLDGSGTVDAGDIGTMLLRF